MKSLAAIVGIERIRLVKEVLGLFEQLDLDIPKSDIEAFTRDELKEQIKQATLSLEELGSNDGESVLPSDILPDSFWTG